MTASASLHVLIEGFFLEWMGRERNLSGNTIASYRDTFSLFFRWLQKARGIDPADAIMADLSAANVNDFLVYLAEGRGCSAKTVNCRLAAFWSFAGYAMRKAPQHIGQLAEISKIPSHKARRREIDFLTPDEVGWMAECCELGSDTELMVAMLYNSGARISELVALRVEDVRVSQKGSCHVHFLGKGGRTGPFRYGTTPHGFCCRTSSVARLRTRITSSPAGTSITLRDPGREAGSTSSQRGPKPLIQSSLAKRSRRTSFAIRPPWPCWRPASISRPLRYGSATKTSTRRTSTWCRT